MNKSKYYESLINEIWEKFRENDYPGSSLQCGIYPKEYNNGKSSALYYPAKKCLMLDDEYIINHVYSHEHAERILRKIHGHYSKGKKNYYKRCTYYEN